MANISIGLSGLRVAQQALDLIGTNISNAGTEGYHRQRPVIAPVELGSAGGISYGGAYIAEVTRCYDKLLQTELMSQQPLMGQVDKELFALENIESALGEIDSENILTTLGKFFNNLRELSAQPDSQALQEQAVWSADSAAQQIRNLADFLTRVEQHIRQEAHELASRINNLTEEIAELNDDIESAILRGSSANILKDHRDQRIKELAGLVDVEVEHQEDRLDSANVLVWGMPLVVGGHVSRLDVSTMSDDRLGVSMEGSTSVQDDVKGGTLGGLVSLQNELIPDIRHSLDSFTRELISQFNKLHVEGLGPKGAFTELTGSAMGGSSELSEWPWEVTDGMIQVRLTDTSDGTVTRHAVEVDVTGGDTMSDVAARFDAIDGLKGWVADSALQLAADPGYEFDFSPSVLSEPTDSGLTGTSSAEISGVFTGDGNDTFTCTIVGDGPAGTLAEVGAGEKLILEVRNTADELVKTFNIGKGYAPGTEMELGNGIKISLDDGTVGLDETFEVDAWGQTDTSGLLAAAGINTFFRGHNASNIAVEDRMIKQPSNLASGLNAEFADNANVARLSEVANQRNENLEDQTLTEFFQTFVTGIGESVNVRKARQSSLENITNQLMKQRDEISGVDINEQVAQLMVFERMFQASAKVIGTQSTTLQYLMNIL